MPTLTLCWERFTEIVHTVIRVDVLKFWDYQKREIVATYEFNVPENHCFRVCKSEITPI